MFTKPTVGPATLVDILVVMLPLTTLVAELMLGTAALGLMFSARKGHPREDAWKMLAGINLLILVPIIIAAGMLTTWVVQIVVCHLVAEGPLICRGL